MEYELTQFESQLDVDDAYQRWCRMEGTFQEKHKLYNFLCQIFSKPVSFTKKSNIVFFVDNFPSYKFDNYHFINKSDRYPDIREKQFYL